MTTTETNGWTYMFSIVKGVKEANIYISNGLTDKESNKYFKEFKVECVFDSKTQEVVEDITLAYCRDIGENFVMGG